MTNVKMKNRKKLSEEGNKVLKEMLTSQLINFGPISKSSDQMMAEETEMSPNKLSSFHHQKCILKIRLYIIIIDKKNK